MTQNWQQTIPLRLRLRLWVLLLTVLAILLWAGLTEVSTQVVIKGRLEATDRPLILKAPTKGRVLYLWAQMGEEIKAGQPLVLLDGLGVDQADTRLKLRNQQLQLAQAENSLRSNSTPDQQIQLKQERARMAQLVNLSRIKITSPGRGRLLQAVNEGKTVVQGETLAEIELEHSAALFKAVLPVTEDLELKPGDTVKIAWEGFAEERFGTTVGQVMSLIKNKEATAVNILLQSPKVGDHLLSPGLQGQVRLARPPKRVLELFWEWLRG